MSTFAVPQPGQVITVTTYYKSNVIGRTKEDDMTTYENVPVITPQSWTKPNEFCIPAEGEPYITFRTININRVTDLTVEGKVGEVATSTSTEYKKIPGGKGNVYTVTLVNGLASTCECLGFQYRGQCRHLRIAMGETPVNPRRETIKKHKRKAAVAKRKARQPGAPTKADTVRSIIRDRKAAMGATKAGRVSKDVEEQVRQWCITDTIEKVGMSRSLATTYVKNNWEKV